MNPSTFDIREARVAEILIKAAGRVRPQGRGRWKVSLSNGARLQVDAALDEEWCDLNAAIPGMTKQSGTARKDLWGLLSRNREMPPGVRVVLPPGERNPRLDAEIAIDGDDVPEAALTRRLQGLKTAAGILRRKPRPEGVEKSGRPENAGAVEKSGRSEYAASAGNAEGPDEAAMTRLADLLADAGWEPTASVPNRIAVKLDAPGKACYAHATLADWGGARFAIDFDDIDGRQEQSDATRAAAAMLVLRVAAAVRLARPFRTTGENPVVGFEVVGSTAPTATWCENALCSLSMACRLCAAEARAVRNQSVAMEYLQSCGWE